ncbi:hypothetical protein Tco_0528685 [Tanacetum coccineum]
MNEEAESRYPNDRRRNVEPGVTHLKNSRSYLVITMQALCIRIISALQVISFAKKRFKGRLLPMGYLLCSFNEFDFDVLTQKELRTLCTDHNHAFDAFVDTIPRFADIANYHAGNFVDQRDVNQQKRKLMPMTSQWLPTMVPTGGHHGATYTARKVFDSEFIAHQSTKNAHESCFKNGVTPSSLHRVSSTNKWTVEDCPDCEDSQFCHSSRVSHPQLHLGIRYPNLID